MLALIAASLLSSTACPPGEVLMGGEHTRLVTKRGAVHLWCRSGSQPKNVVVYVHGYRDDVDTAFTNHRLAEQFAKSGLDALFLAVAAPSGPGQPVMFGDLDELLKLVNAEGPVLVLGHSGGNRTMKSWLTSARVREVVLLDGFYGDAKPWTKWLSSKSDATLRMVGQHTWAKAETWRVALPLALRAQVTHERAGCPHMEIVTNGEWLPRVIRESSLADTISG